jgi:uncharacterized phage protein gp47/JayE
MLSLAQLVTPQTPDQIKTTLLARLAAAGFPVTDWLSGGVARTLVEIFAAGLSDLTTLIAAIAAGGFVDYATGDWLTLLAYQLYELDRNEATFTRGDLVLRDSASAGPFTIVAGELFFQSDGGLRFTNIKDGTLPKGGALTLRIQAESPGASYNVATGSIRTMLTPLPGVTCNNPRIAGRGTWITASGTNEETDASLQSRCKARWPTLGSAATGPVYDLWAKTASSQVTRTQVTADPNVPGQVDLLIAGSAGALGQGVINAVAAYIDPRIPLTSTLKVESAVDDPVDIAATVYVTTDLEQAAEDAINLNLGTLIQSIPIGGTVYLSTIIDVLQNPEGVRNVELTQPPRDLVLPLKSVATQGTFTIKYVALQ